MSHAAFVRYSGRTEWNRFTSRSEPMPAVDCEPRLTVVPTGPATPWVVNPAMAAVAPMNDRVRASSRPAAWEM
jgi:hypothetical protein